MNHYKEGKQPPTLKILVVTGIFPPDIGGPATYVPQIAKGLVGQGHSLTVVTLRDQLVEDLDTYPFDVVRIYRKSFLPWRWLKTIWTIMRIGKNVDVLFVNGLAIESFLANLVLRKPAVLKIVGDIAWERSTNRGWVNDTLEKFQEGHYGWLVRLVKGLRTFVVRKADKIIVPSYYLSKFVRKWGVPDEKIVVVYNAIALAGQVSRLEVPLPTALNLVTVGRLVPWKRIDKILETLSSLKNVGLVVIGEGPERENLERLAQSSGIREKVYFTGQLRKPYSLALLSSCDIFLLNSTYEGFSHVILEAMSVGIPVVATAVGGNSEIIQDRINGRLVDPWDPNALLNTLSSLLENGLERERLGIEGRKSLEKFSLGQMIRKTESVLSEAVNL